MSNPYESPADSGPNISALQEVKVPAIAMMVVAIFAIGIGFLGFLGDAYLVLSGIADQLDAMNPDDVSAYTQILVRTIWGIALVIASFYVLYGSLQMKKLKNYGTAKTAAVVAFIPCLGPCCILGIPFGIWAFTVLNKPHVKDAFS